jgi:CheY-like chemotaxis protein
VTLATSDSHVEITVSDTGEGISADFLPHVFERFRQGDSATTRRYGGLGLGLSIVKHLVELHGGAVEAQSPGPAQGSTFRVALPLAPMQAAETDVGHPHQTAPISDDVDRQMPSLNGVRILVVDDEPDALDLLRRLLGARGAAVTAAISAADAMQLIESAAFDLIVSDIGMPERDGYELIRSLRALPAERGGKTPAVALTAFAHSEDRTRAMLAGFDVHVAKPVEPSELCAVAARLAGRTT